MFGPGQKIGSSEQLLFLNTIGGNYTFGFYDDGSHMHIPSATGPYLLTGYPADNQVGTPFPSWLARVYEDPAGTPVPSDPVALVTQSGTSLSWSPVNVFMCPLGSGDSRLFQASGSTVRHTINSGVVSSHVGSGVYELEAFRW